ncbi:hypothetical protein [Thauera humireducens]|uniref:hypothetical protein n=1 Tax=Thauera humireducens TaxID=1134435 RepID=UPI00311E0DB0
MKNDRRRLLLAAGAVLAQAALPGAARALAADTTVETQQPGALRIAVYADFPPYSARGKGVDVALGKALAEMLGLRAEFVEFPPAKTWATTCATWCGAATISARARAT